MNLEFKRDYEIAGYIVDFYCHEQRLCIEIDCGLHLIARQKAIDAYRDSVITSQGYRVMRYSLSEVIENCKGVLQKIEADIKEMLKEPVE